MTLTLKKTVGEFSVFRREGRLPSGVARYALFNGEDKLVLERRRYQPVVRWAKAQHPLTPALSPGGGEGAA